ncbi:MAG: ATP-binding cassette domain-containing protein, partial [Acidimicrobiales bacterium]
MRNRIGYVPQDDVLHQQLTVREVLEYSAELRFPPDVAASDRHHRVEEVMAELGLTQRAGLSVSRLSGGQRKRASMAIELLTRPSLLVLDEPTSGLDPGYEKSVMHLLRDLADGGRTVVAVTHSTHSLERCDRLLVLAPGGQTAYFGPPTDALGWFSKPDYADVFQYLDQAPAGAAKAAFAGSPAEERYVVAPLALPGANLSPGAAAGGGGARGGGAGGGGAGGGGAAWGGAAGSPEATKRAAWGRQFVTLTRRYVSVLTADRRNTLLLVLQAPVLGLLMMAVFGHDNLVAANPGSRLNAPTVLVGLILGATYLGASNSIREIVKERGILERDRAIGTSASAYVMSKVVVLGGITLVQAAILLAFGIARQGRWGGDVGGRRRGTRGAGRRVHAGGRAGTRLDLRPAAPALGGDVGRRRRGTRGAGRRDAAWVWWRLSRLGLGQTL